MWEEGVRIYDTPRVHNNFSYLFVYRTRYDANIFLVRVLITHWDSHYLCWESADVATVDIAYPQKDVTSVITVPTPSATPSPQEVCSRYLSLN